jgi:excisionase family DNA binding protein
MVTEEPKISDAGRYSVTETAKLLGIHRDTLRRYTESRLIKFGLRRTNGRKFYLGSEIKRFWRSSF